ncbi:MAG: 1-deoxy-D-xylulose-5-phosphate reductoisomerase, partial [Holosporales bacterium]|nr:1-deoxy-D-xylulose-5-phosphate reductoisomerase [Holosporales bacterium]
QIIPIDSEHNAIFQCLVNEDINEINKIILTASGGPFLNFEENELNNITPLEALSHPNWDMGKKITIDSATLINKALEIIEAHCLFDIDIEKIEALIHPNSIIHGMVMFQDGSYKSVMSSPNMAMPISFALNFPQRKPCDMKEINFEEIGKLEFQKPKSWQKRNIDLAYWAVKERKTIALNLANEKYVYEFLSGKIKFSEIYEKTYKTLLKSEPESINSAEDIRDILTEQKSDCQAR